MAVYNTLGSLIQFNDKNLADLEVTDLLQSAPLLNVLYAQVASNGTQHKYTKETVASSAAFRQPNVGVTKTHSEDQLVSLNLIGIDGSFSTDVLLADGYKDGRDAWLQKELMRTMRAIMFKLERQVIYGTATNGSGALADAAGYAGLADNASLNQIADAMVVAAGSPNATADSGSSVYLLNHGENDNSFILGNDGNFTVEEDPTLIKQDDGSGKFFPALYVAVHGWGAFQYGGLYSAARIANVGTSLTDDDIYNAISLFPSDRQPNAIVMNRKSLKLLRQSRTATNATGAPAPRPTDVDGIPIIVTDSVRGDEPVIA